MMKNLLLLAILLLALIASVALVKVNDSRRKDAAAEAGDEALYVTPATAKHLALGFNGLAADWYWMRSLQYVGGKIVAFEDTHQERFGLSDLDLHLLPSLLQMSTALDPQFLAPYEYGAMILPELNTDQAIALVNSGIANNPSTWRLYQHIGYIYWRLGDYDKASASYAAGAKLSGAPPWMAAMGARMKAEGGSRDAAREMYRHLYDSSADETVRDMVTKQLMRLDYLDQREAIRNVLNGYKEKNGRCVGSWREVANELRAAGLQLDARTAAPFDPSSTPYELIKNGCDLGLNINTSVPFK